ncbi:hypothetical protein PtA15_7A654 [Puccinia triticina]|uniref:Uncharacterized protein n=1 Tax=Puccinia triticina TaxID=208348 RepID=A0ABY7CQH4_9BASI|nr:uncharacterized protein PtA15_7A654 [Puccinia triticina]WAQ86925.1 hypothetical protein PtA15_7A654 [Puccinia triticina]
MFPVPLAPASVSPVPLAPASVPPVPSAPASVPPAPPNPISAPTDLVSEQAGSIMDNNQSLPNLVTSLSQSKALSNECSPKALNNCLPENPSKHSKTSTEDSSEKAPINDLQADQNKPDSSVPTQSTPSGELDSSSTPTLIRDPKSYNYVQGESDSDSPEESDSDSPKEDIEDSNLDDYKAKDNGTSGASESDNQFETVEKQEADPISPSKSDQCESNQNALAEPTQPARLPPLGRADPTCSTATSRSLCAARDRKQQKDLINTLKAKAQCLVNTLTRKLKKILCIPRVRRAAQALGPGDCNAYAKSLGIMPVPFAYSFEAFPLYISHFGMSPAIAICRALLFYLYPRLSRSISVTLGCRLRMPSAESSSPIVLCDAFVHDGTAFRRPKASVRQP